jgi:hypothetical protein
MALGQLGMNQELTPFLGLILNLFAIIEGWRLGVCAGLAGVAAVMWYIRTGTLPVFYILFLVLAFSAVGEGQKSGGSPGGWVGFGCGIVIAFVWYKSTLAFIRWLGKRPTPNSYLLRKLAEPAIIILMVSWLTICGIGTGWATRSLIQCIPSFTVRSQTSH